MLDIAGTRISLLDKGYVELQDMMGDDLAIVNAARTSVLGESKGQERDKQLLFYLMEHEHLTPFEMVEFKFRVKCPIFVARQWMRSRTWSYNEQSRRYTSEDVEFYVPEEWRGQSKADKQNSDGLYSANEQDHEYWARMLNLHCKSSVELYQYALDNGVSREMARFFLPVNLYTTFIGKVNARNLMHFLKLRMDSHAQYEIRVYADAIYNNIFKPALPWTAEAFETFVLGA